MPRNLGEQQLYGAQRVELEPHAVAGVGDVGRGQDAGDDQLPRRELLVRREQPPSNRVDHLLEVGAGLAGRLVRRGTDVCLLAVGKLVADAEAAADALEADGISATVWDVRCVKPLDEAMLADAAEHRAVVTVEDGLRDGGAGSAMADAIGRSARTAGRVGPPVTVLGVPSQYLAQGKPDAILAELGLDADGIAEAARRLVRIPSA